jgi:hypothetical protein
MAFYRFLIGAFGTGSGREEGRRHKKVVDTEKLVPTVVVGMGMC